MLTTTRQEVHPTITHGGNPAPTEPNELVPQYEQIVREQRLNWTSHLRLLKVLGSGGQGVVYLTELRGTDEFTLPAAVKIFSPQRFEDVFSYDDTMHRAAHAAARIAQIQHDNLLNVYNFVDRHRIRMLVMEWIDGYDLARLLGAAHAGADSRPRQRPPLGIHQPGDRHRRPRPAADEGRRGRGDRPRLPERPGGPAPARHRPRRHQALEHHAQADGDRQNRRYRLGLRAAQPAPLPLVHARVRRAGSARKPRKRAAQRPLLAGLRADRVALRPPAVRRHRGYSRAAGGQADAAHAAASRFCRRRCCGAICSARSSAA